MASSGPKKWFGALVIPGMRFHRSSLRRTPDWQMGCIDSKWRWIVPWGVFGVVGATVTLLCCTPGICLSIERNTFYEFRLQFANPAKSPPPGAMVVRIDSEKEIQLGEVRLDVSPPKIQTDDQWLFRQLEWKQELIRKKNIRAAVRQELGKKSVTPTVVVRVTSQVPLETIAIVWTSIQAVSNATLYLEVCD